MNATSIRPLNLMAQEEDQGAPIRGVGSYGDDCWGAEEAMIRAAMQAKVGTMGGLGWGTHRWHSPGKWPPGVSTDRIAERGPISLPPEVPEQLFFRIQGYPRYLVTFQLLITHGILCWTVSW